MSLVTRPLSVHPDALNQCPILGGKADMGRVALANKIARMAWAIMVRGERYTEPKLLQAA